MPLPGAPPANPSPAPTPAEPLVDWVYPALRRIRPAGLAVTVWTTRLLLAATFGIFAWEAYDIIRRIWSAIANRTLRPFPWSNLFPLWSAAALLATLAVFTIGWFAFGNQNEMPSDTLRRVRQDPAAEHWAHVRA